MIIMHHRLVLQTFLEKTNIMEKIYKIWGMGGRRGLERNQTPLLIAGLQFLVYNIFLVLKEENFMKTTRNWNSHRKRWIGDFIFSYRLQILFQSCISHLWEFTSATKRNRSWVSHEITFYLKFEFHNETKRNLLQVTGQYITVFVNGYILAILFSSLLKTKAIAKSYNSI